MEELKNYWWMLITIPALTLLIYIVTNKSMKGLAILSILFGSAIIILWFTLYQLKENTNLLVGIIWLVLGLGWLAYNQIKKKKEQTGHKATED